MKLGDALIFLMVVLILTGVLVYACVNLAIENQDLEKTKKELKIENAQLKPENDQLKQENEQLKQENGQLKTENGQLKTDKENIQKQLQEAEAQNAALKAQVDALQNQPQIERDSHIATPLQSRMEAKTLQQQPQTQAISLNWTLIFLGWAVLLVLMTAGVVALGLRKPRRRGYPYYD